MTVNDQLRRSSERVQNEVSKVPIPIVPASADRRMSLALGAGLAVVLAIVTFVWLIPYGRVPGPPVRNVAIGDAAMVREWVEGALAGRFDEIAVFTYGESGEPEAMAQLAQILRGYQSQYGKPEVTIAPFETSDRELAFTCLTLDFGRVEVSGGMVLRDWPDLGRRLWEFRSGMTGCRGETSVTTTLPAAPTGVVPIDPGPLEGRFGHSVVWTGAEVIVWGGHRGDLADTFSDGAAFNPDTNEWRMIAEAPLDGMTWHFVAWSGDEMLVVGTSGAAAYDPVDDSWRQLPAPPIPIHRVGHGDIADLTEFTWSGSHIYVWNPISDELARFAPSDGTWEQIEGPGLNVFPAKVVAEGDRVLVFGTRWPSGLAKPQTYELFGAELTHDGWVELPPVDFLSDSYANVADPGTASLVGDLVLVWGDPSIQPGPAQLLHPDRSWSSVPPPPIDENMLHPRPILLDDGRVLALSEGNAAIWEPTFNDWTPIGPFPVILGAREAVWTGREVIAWSAGESWRWVPPPSPPS